MFPSAVDEYVPNTNLAEWSERRGIERSPEKDKVFEDRFLADGGVYIDAGGD